MNVTSLLNANAAEQQKKEDSLKSTPTKNRTPWDAGGYALPINTTTSVPMVQSLSSSTARTSTPAQINVQMMEEESIQDAPLSPRHKFSDSRSSLSSFASSIQSASHSRFSSLSTVGSLQQVNSIDEALSRQKDQSFDIAMITPRNFDANRPSISAPQSRGSISPTSSMEALVLAAERHSVSQRPALQRNLSMGDSSLSQTTEKPSLSPANGFVLRHRPSSPSDAILIKRTAALPMLRVMTGDRDLRASDDSNINRTYLNAPLDYHINSLITNNRGHKRAISAPNFGDLSNPSFQMSQISSSPNAGPCPAPTPPHSTHPDNESPMSPIDAIYPAPDTPPANIDINNNDMTLRCMFVENCKTESQLRKAISHIFGRNKMCTRQIPDQIWVHYCRKHYQRSRYRDPKRFVKVQSDLVLQQIHQIHNWSEQNRLNGRPGVVESWGLAVRKREQKRLDDLSSNRKRTASVLDSDVDIASGLATSQPHTAVPDWMLELTGTGYATSQMLEIFGRLQEEVSINKHMSFPDVEILPNIIVNQDEPKSPKGYAKRSSAPGGSGHKRAQSLGVNMKSDYFSNSRISSQPQNTWVPDGSHPGSVYSSPIQKRRRGNELGENNSPVATFRNHLERPIEANRRMSSFSQQPMYNIAEHEVVNERYIQQAPLPAPIAQRLGGQTMANHLEDGQYNQVRRQGGHHQRSQSDMGALSRGHLGYPAQVPSSVYTPEMQQSQFGRPTYHEQPRVHQYPSPQPQWQPIPMQNMQPMHSGYQRPVSQHQSGFGNVHQHHRNQSTPMVQMGYGHHPGQNFGAPSGYEHNRGVIMEDPQSRNMYAPRH